MSPTPNMIGNTKTDSITDLLEAAHDVVDDIVSRSRIFDATSEASLPQFEESELSLGKVIGRGGFCVVREITKIKSRDNKESFSSFSSLRGSERKKKSSFFSSMRSSSSLSARSTSALKQSSSSIAEESSVSTPTYITKEFLVKTSRRPRYVMKRVSDEFKNENKDTYVKGCIDLALEAKYLSSLSHPSILDVRGVAACGPFSGGYFIIIDRLDETLPKRLNNWMTVDRQTKGVTGLFTGGRSKVNDLLVKRLLVAFDIASALAYLHELRVVYRDLKPGNIGFDKNGKVKLFDFGLAKELNEDERTKDGLYRMTGFTGSVRYMSPEVGTGKPYNEKADVYSFSILLWYFMALEPPFGLYTPRMIRERVPKGNRPVLMDAWPEGVKKLLNVCWSGKIKSRPSFETVMKLLKVEVAAVDPERALEMHHYAAKQPVEASIEMVTPQNLDTC